MAHMIDEDETYRYEILHETHIEESTKLLTDAFTKCNPLEVFLKITYEELYAQALACSKAALDDQLSIVAVHKQTGEIHGLVQAGDATKLKVESFGELEWSKDIEVYEELERRYMEQYVDLKENDLVEIIMLGVRQDCSRKGLATKLNEIVLAHCGRRGFKHAMVETTNPAAHHIYTKKLNGRVFTSIYLPTFVTRDGQRPFEHYDAEISLIVFELQ